jgi:hypothetical protein
MKLLENKSVLSLILASLLFLVLLIAFAPAASANSLPTIKTAGQVNVLDVNKFFGSTMHYAPNQPIFIKHGTSFLLEDTTNDFHTFTLVTVGGLPRTASDVAGCGTVSVDICQAAFIPHGFFNLPPNTGPNTSGSPPGYTGNCESFNGVTYVSPGDPSANVFQCVDGGNPVNDATSAFPQLSTPFSCSNQANCNLNGDSIVIFPGDQIMLTISSSVHPGTVLHFMCVIHPWMQGEIIVT